MKERLFWGIVIVVALAAFAWIAMVGINTDPPATSVYAPASESPTIMAELSIVPGWTYTIEDDWSYIRGSVKNTGDIPIDYFEVHAEYKSADGSVLDTDWTNSGEVIKPGAQKKFEIMHQHEPGFTKASISVQWYKP